MTRPADPLALPDEPVLIVDDNPKNIQVLGAVLSQEGYLISVARSGAQALEMAGRAHPGLVLLDVMMPEMDGYETCKRLKEDPALRDTPVIFLTARTEKEATVRGFEVGAVDFVTKPFDSEELLARVRTQMELRRSNRRLQAANQQLRAAQEQQQRLQEELLAAERRTTLLEAAGGAAHELGQPLQGITTLVELQLADLAPQDPHRETYLEVLQLTQRIDAIVRRMQTLDQYSSKPYPGGGRIADFGVGNPAPGRQPSP